jgi:signal transduction histidine kinase
VQAAEQAEREADRALRQAREAVREAREHVRALELEAKEEARLAKIKQTQAASIGKSARGLGRKFIAPR